MHNYLKRDENVKIGRVDVETEGSLHDTHGATSSCILTVEALLSF